jgi:hypothetical protein
MKNKDNQQDKQDSVQTRRLPIGAKGEIPKRGSEPAVTSDFSGNSIFLALPGAK